MKVINAENLGKKYIISHQAAAEYQTLRETIVNKVRTLAPNRKNIVPKKEKFWALRNVSFDAEKGDRIGIIGRNGAGKTTLLKILSRITEPSEGRVKIYGRVSSLLEVGTGFHPELTGRENVYLNGAILGMGKKEIRKKFDGIVDFSGVEKFLDTPVKRYSSGMYVRLAFSIAANMEPDILVVDEVLAVGDAGFQKKCLGKMDNISKKEGRTVLFVSHNLPLISNLCNKAILLEKGKVVTIGETRDVILKYHNLDNNTPISFDHTNDKKKFGDSIVELLKGSVLNKDNKLKSEFGINEIVKVQIEYNIKEEINYKLIPFFKIFNSEGAWAFSSSPENLKILPRGKIVAECIFPKNLLNDGIYSVNVQVRSFHNGPKAHFEVENALFFNMKDRNIFSKEKRHGFSGRFKGIVRPKLKWKISN